MLKQLEKQQIHNHVLITFLEYVNSLILEHKLRDLDTIPLNIKSDKVSRNIKKNYLYPVTDFERLSTLMQQVGWYDVLNENDSYLCLNNLIRILKNMIKNHEGKGELNYKFLVSCWYLSEEGII